MDVVHKPRPDLTFLVYRLFRPVDLAQVAIHVPFQISDVIVAQQVVQIAPCVVAHILPGEVQHILEPPFSDGLSCGAQRPFGVTAV